MTTKPAAPRTRGDDPMTLDKAFAIAESHDEQLSVQSVFDGATSWFFVLADNEGCVPPGFGPLVVPKDGGAPREALIPSIPHYVSGLEPTDDELELEFATEVTLGV